MGAGKHDVGEGGQQSFDVKKNGVSKSSDSEKRTGGQKSFNHQCIEVYYGAVKGGG